MSKYLGLGIIVFSLIIFFVLQWLSLGVYLKFTLLIFGIGVGIVLLTILPLLTQMKGLEQTEEETAEKVPEDQQD